MNRATPFLPSGEAEERGGAKPDAVHTKEPAYENGREIGGGLLLWELSDPDDYDPRLEDPDLAPTEDDTIPPSDCYPNNFDSFSPLDYDCQRDRGISCNSYIPAGLACQDSEFVHGVVDPAHGSTTEPTFERKEEENWRHTYIDLPQFWELWRAVNFANQKGMVMNGELTLTFGEIGCSTPADCRKAFAVFLDRLGSWHQTRGRNAVYCYCWENSSERGLHIHMQIYLPPKMGRDFQRWAKNTVRTLHNKQGVQSDQPCVRRPRREAKPYSQWRWTQYLLKGIGPGFEYRLDDGSWQRASDMFGIQPRYTGEIPWKRVGVSHSIGRKARSEGQFREPPLDFPFCPKQLWSDWSFEDFKRRDLMRQFCKNVEI